MKPIRVLHLASPGIGGIENYIFSHYKYMDRSRFKFDFLTQNRGLKNAKEFQQFNYEVKLLPTTAAKDRELFIREVKEILTEGRYDVFHLNTCYWTGFLLEEIAQEVGVPKVIVHSHSSFIDENDPDKRERLLRRHEEIKAVFPAGLATDFWACSGTAADWLFGPQIPREQIRIMKNAIELERFQFSRQKREQIRAELGLENSLVLGTTGRLTYSKNHLFLIEVFAAFLKVHPSAKLLVIGDGELRPEIEKQIQCRGLEDSVRLLGWCTNVEDYLQAMDIFLLPSRFEGNPVSLMEAAASGLPCVIAEGITEETQISENIWRVPLKLAEWLITLESVSAKNPDRRTGADIVRDAGFDVKRQAKKLEKLYTEET